MSNRFTNLFGGFENERLQEAFADCEIKNVKISMEMNISERQVNVLAKRVRAKISRV